MKDWLPAAAGMLCLGFGAGLIGVYGFFVEPLSSEFGVSVALLNLGPVALLLVPGVISPIIGRLSDRVPIRRLILTGVTIAMLSLLAVSRAPAMIWAGLGFLCFSLGLVCYGPVVINGLMVKLYPGREARALAIAAIGISIASAILPPLVGMLLAIFDWRQTLAMLAMALAVLLWLGVLAAIPAGTAGGAVEERGQLDRSIYRDPNFWLIGLCVAIGLNVAIVLTVCYPPLFVSRGFSVAEAGWFLSLAGMSGLLGKAFLGGFGDALRAHARWVAAGCLLIQMCGLITLYFAENTQGVIVAMALVGFSGGAFIPVHPFLNARYFDAAIIGQVNGAQMPLFLPFGLVGAPLAGYTFDVTGSYDLVLLALMVALMVAALLATRLSGEMPGEKSSEKMNGASVP